MHQVLQSPQRIILILTIIIKRTPSFLFFLNIPSCVTLTLHIEDDDIEDDDIEDDYIEDDDIEDNETTTYNEDDDTEDDDIDVEVTKVVMLEGSVPMVQSFK